MKIHWKVSVILAAFSLVLWVAHHLIFKHSRTELMIVLVLIGLLTVAALAHLIHVWVTGLRHLVGLPGRLREANLERKRRGIRWHLAIATLACLLSFATSASAECAWVLWSALTIPAAPDAGWDVVTAYPTMQECESALAKEFQRLTREGWEAHYVQIRTVLASKGKGEKIVATHFRCLPDTIDPRGPKWK